MFGQRQREAACQLFYACFTGEFGPAAVDLAGYFEFDVGHGRKKTRRGGLVILVALNCDWKKPTVWFAFYPLAAFHLSAYILAYFIANLTNSLAVM